MLLSIFGSSLFFLSQEDELRPLAPCLHPSIEGDRVSCNGEGKKANDLFVLFENRLNLNEASAAELALIPKMRKNVAEAIVEARENLGSFSNYDEVSEIKGVGPKTLEAIKEYTLLR